MYLRFGVIAAAALTVGSSQANLITNGSFELGGFVNQGNDTMSLQAGSNVITGWTVVTDTTAWIGPANPFGLSASDGSYFLDLTNYQANAPFAGLSQTIATTPGATYSLSFDLGGSSRWGLPDSITASAAGLSQTFTSTATIGVDDLWDSVSTQFVATSATTTVLLQGASGINYVGLDNVDVELISGPEQAPEPTTITLLGLGLVGLLSRCASRRRSGLASEPIVQK